MAVYVTIAPSIETEPVQLMASTFVPMLKPAM